MKRKSILDTPIEEIIGKGFENLDRRELRIRIDVSRWCMPGVSKWGSPKENPMKTLLREEK